MFIIISNNTPRSHNRNSEYCLLKGGDQQEHTTNSSILQSVPPPLPPFPCCGVFCGSLISTTDTKVESNYVCYTVLPYVWLSIFPVLWQLWPSSGTQTPFLSV